MPRNRTFQVRCINIRVHTQHAPSEYEALWKALHRLKRPLVYRSGIAVMIGTSVKIEAARLCMGGELYRFVQVNEDDAWFNIADHKPAKEEELEEISIPQHLRPNLQSTRYVFDLEKHRLYVVTRSAETSLSIGQVLKLLEALVSQPSIVERFGQVDLTVATSAKSVQELLKLPILRKLELVLDRPNPTDYEDEEAVFRHLDNIGASREVREYTKAREAPTLVPDEEMTALAAVAADNGEVRVVGTGKARERVIASSKQFPWEGASKYNPQNMTLFDALRSFVNAITGRLP